MAKGENNQLSFEGMGGGDKKRRKSAVTPETTDNVFPNNVQPFDPSNPYYGPNRPGDAEKVVLPTTIGIPVPVNKMAQFDVPADTSLELQQQKADEIRAQAEKQIDANNKAAVLVPYIQANTNPTEAINDKIDEAELKNTIQGGPVDNTFSEAKRNAVGANQAIMDTGSGLAKIAALTRTATENPNAMSQVTMDDIYKAQTDVDDAFLSGDPLALQKQQLLNYFTETPNIKYAEPAIERLGVSEYYPDLGQPIRVGGYSGSIVGSNDIYVAQGNVFPASIMDARARALQGAAKEKAKMKDRIFEMATVKAAYPYQDQFDNATMSLLNKYGEAVNWDYSKLDPVSSKLGMKMYQDITKLKTLGRVSQELENKGKDLLTKFSGNEKVFVSPEQQQMLEQFFKGDWNIEKVMSDPDARKEYLNLANKWNAYDNMTFHAQGAAKLLKESMDKVPLKLKAGLNMNDPQIAKAFADLSTVDQHRDYDRYTRAMLTFVDDPRIEEAAKGLINQHRFAIGGTEEKQLEKVKTQIAAYLGKQMDITDQIARNNALGWARLADDKQARQQFQPYTTLFNNAANPETKGIIQGVYSNQNLTKKQQTNIIANNLEKAFGGKLLRKENGDHNFEFQLPFKVEKNKDYKFNTSQLYNKSQREKWLKAVGPEGDEEVKNALMNPNAVVGAELVNRKAQYYVPVNGGKVLPVTEDDLRKDPSLVSRMKPFAKNEYKPYVEVMDPVTGRPVRKYFPSTANVIDDLENINARAEYDADVKDDIPTMNRDIKQGQNTYVTEEFPGVNEPDL